MTKKSKIWLYFLSCAVFCGLIYALSSVLLPFIAATIIAYFLDPLADRLESYGTSRTAAAAIISGAFLMIIVLLSWLIVPLLYTQLLSLFAAIPGYVEVMVADFYPKIFDFATQHGLEVEPDFYSYLNGENISSIFSVSGDLVGSIMQSGVVLINVFSLIFITPILVFYMLRDWDILVAKVIQYLPPNGGAEIRSIFKH